MHFLEKDENFINFPVFLREGKTELMHQELCVSKRYNYGVVEYAFPQLYCIHEIGLGRQQRRGAF